MDIAGNDTQKANEALIKAQSSALANGTSKTSAATAKDTLSSDISFFLKMLTTQLKNQDPTQPMDVAQMTQQIAQYSGVEQQVKTNSNLEKLLANNKQSQQSTAVGYIGKEIESKGSTGLVYGGQGAFAYSLPEEASEVKISIKNKAGATVFSGQGTKDVGHNIVIWDGKNSSTGQQEADGTYTISVQAVSKKTGSAMTAELRAVGIVNGVESDTDGTVYMTVGSEKVKFDDVLSVRAATRANLGTNDEAA